MNKIVNIIFILIFATFISACSNIFLNKYEIGKEFYLANKSVVIKNFDELDNETKEILIKINDSTLDLNNKVEIYKELKRIKKDIKDNVNEG